MPYNRFYSEFTDEHGWQYTLYILPSNANAAVSQANLSTLTDFTLVELPDDFLMKDIKIETELGEIPAGLVSQVMSINVNIAALQGTNSFDELRECLLRGTVATGVAYQSNGTMQPQGTASIQFDRFNTFILMVNDGSGARPIFIGCQKFSAENELTITKLSDVCMMKIECFDVLRSMTEQIQAIHWAEYMLFQDPYSIDYGNSYSANCNARYDKIQIGTAFYTSPDALSGNAAYDFAIDKFNFTVNTFENLKAQIDTMLTSVMRSITWNVSSVATVPILFAKAWTFYQQRLYADDTYGMQITKPAFVNEIIQWQADGTGRRLGGAIYDNTAFGKFNNFYEVFTALVENSLEIYRLNLSYSSVNGFFGIAYTSDFIRPLTGSGITFNSQNIYSDIKFKLFQETVKSAESSVSTLQGEKDTKTFPYQEGTSSDNGKDVELIFHNLPSATNRKMSSRYDSAGSVIHERNAINAGTILFNNSGSIEKVDTECRFKYSNTDAIQLTYPIYQVDGEVNTQMIIEQQNAGLPLTIAKGIVKSLGDAKQCVVEFKAKHTLVGFEDVGTNCTINLNDLNPLITKIYNANTGTGVITQHKLDVYSGTCDISVRMYG